MAATTTCGGQRGRHGRHHSMMSASARYRQGQDLRERKGRPDSRMAGAGAV